MDRFYVLRLYGTSSLFAGFKQREMSMCSTEEVRGPEPVFVCPGPGRSVQASIIHCDDVKETEKDLKKFQITVERIQIS